MQKVRKAVIPAAGFGTRFLPATKAMSKEMLPVVDIPTIQYIVEEIRASGIEQILIISSHAKRAIEDHFDSSPELENHLYQAGKLEQLRQIRDISSIDIHYIRQKHMRGLGDAIYCAKDFVDGEPFAVILGDDIVYTEGKPALRQLMDQYEATGATILGCQTVPREDVSSYGIVKGKEVDGVDGLMKVEDMVEKPAVKDAPSRMAILGRYVITPDVFDVLSETKPGKGGEIQLTDALRVMSHREPLYAYRFSGRRYDVGNKQGYLQAMVEYALRRDDLKDEFASYLKNIVKGL